MDEDKRLHLQFIQNNISRMNTNSGKVKGWCITIVSALFALYAGTGKIIFIWICLFPTILFCILDTLYLQQEHKFIGLYNDVAGITKNNTIKPFEFTLKQYEEGPRGLIKAFTSWSVFPFYMLILFFTIGFGLFLSC